MQLIDRLSAAAGFLVLAWASVACAGADVPVLRSGVYEGLALAVGPGGSVEGLFVHEQGQGVTKRCSFFLKGAVARDGTVKVDSWSVSARMYGDLRTTPSGLMLRLPQAREHSGCGLVLPSETDFALELSSVEATRWIALRVVSAARVALVDKPGEQHAGKFSLPKGSPLGVLQVKGQWLEVESLLDLNHRAKGWVRQTDASPLAPKP